MKTLVIDINISIQNLSFEITCKIRLLLTLVYYKLEYKHISLVN